MRWFRRQWDDFEVDWSVSDGKYEPVMTDHLPEPWRSHPEADRCVRLPVELVRLFTSEALLIPIERDEQAYLAEIRTSVAQEGIKLPLTIVVDGYGQARLKDGHHRVLIAGELPHLTHLPVLLSESDGIRTHGLKLAEIVPELLRSLHASGQPTDRRVRGEGGGTPDVGEHPTPEAALPSGTAGDSGGVREQPSGGTARGSEPDTLEDPGCDGGQQ